MSCRSVLAWPLTRLRHVFFKCTRAFLNWPKVHEELDYREAYEYKNKFVPRDGQDYGWVQDYARFNFDQLLSANNTIDSKAESLLKIFAGGSGLLSIGAVLQLSKVSFAVAVFWGVSLILAVACIIIASLVRFPKDTFLPPSIAWALEYAESFDKQASERFLAQWHVACEGMRLSNARKTFGLKVAIWLGLSAIIVLALSLVAALATMDVAVNKTNQESVMTQPTNTPPPAPNPTSQPQTPSAGPSTPSGPQASGPQTIQAGRNPAVSAGPQSIQESNARDK